MLLLSEVTCMFISLEFQHGVRNINGLKESDLPTTPHLLQHGHCSSSPFKMYMPFAASY